MMKRLKYIKDDKVKLVKEASKLIEILEADGWKIEKPKAQKKDSK